MSVGDVATGEINDAAQAFGWDPKYVHNRLWHFRDAFDLGPTRYGVTPRQAAALWLFTRSGQEDGRGGNTPSCRVALIPEASAAYRVWQEGWPHTPTRICERSGVTTWLTGMPDELSAGLVELFGPDGPDEAMEAA